MRRMNTGLPHARQALHQGAPAQETLINLVSEYGGERVLFLLFLPLLFCLCNLPLSTFFLTINIDVNNLLHKDPPVSVLFKCQECTVVCLKSIPGIHLHPCLTVSQELPSPLWPFPKANEHKCSLSSRTSQLTISTGISPMCIVWFRGNARR